MNDSRLRIIVTGLIAQYPLGGVTWDYIQYPVGLASMGHDVYYVEDTGQWPYSPVEGGIAKDPTYNVEYLRSSMEQFGLAGRWAYRFPWDSQWFGMTGSEVAGFAATADLVINVSGTIQRPELYGGRSVLAYIDSDPVFTQIKLARGNSEIRNLINAHDVTFSFGETLPGALVDDTYEWIATRQPVLLHEWDTVEIPRDVYTTVMNWTSYKPIEWNGSSFGQKDVELRRMIDLPSRVEAQLEIAMASGKTRHPPNELLEHNGWRIVSPDVVCPDAQSYRRYLQASKGEFSVAKNGYVKGRAGWFSCRSACYLAAGRPVVVQDTGFSDVLPVGEGLLAYEDLEGAVHCLEEVEGRYDFHASAARALAHDYFGSERVLSGLIDNAFSGPQTGGVRNAP